MPHERRDRRLRASDGDPEVLVGVDEVIVVVLAHVELDSVEPGGEPAAMSVVVGLTVAPDSSPMSVLSSAEKTIGLGMFDASSAASPSECTAVLVIPDG